LEEINQMMVDLRENPVSEIDGQRELVCIDMTIQRQNMFFR
jgi:hypothetical protein